MNVLAGPESYYYYYCYLLFILTKGKIKYKTFLVIFTFCCARVKDAQHVSFQVSIKMQCIDLVFSVLNAIIIDSLNLFEFIRIMLPFILFLSYLHS